MKNIILKDAQEINNFLIKEVKGSTKIIKNLSCKIAELDEASFFIGLNIKYELITDNKKKTIKIGYHLLSLRGNNNEQRRLSEQILKIIMESRDK